MSTAPTLTWEMTNLRNPGTPGDPQTVLDTIALSVGDSTTWTVNASSAGYLELAPAGGSATPNLRILVAFGVHSGQVATPHSLTSGVMYVGVAPDGGTLGDPLGSSNPYSSARWSEYWKCSGIITGAAPVDACFVLCADEVISIWMQEAATDDWYGFIAGAFVDPPTDADGEGTPGRIYGMAVTGSQIIGSSFWNGANDFLASSTSSSNSQTGCFDPVTPANFIKLDRMTITALTAPRLETAGGSRMSFPWFCFKEDPPYDLIGVFRQIRVSTDSTMRTVIQDSGAVNKSYHIGGASSTVGDACSFDNS